jgi:hypothetical protein
MSKTSHAKHEKAKHSHEKALQEDSVIEPDFPQEHRALMIAILIVFAFMSTFVFAFFYIFG